MQCFNFFLLHCYYDFYLWNFGKVQIESAVFGCELRATSSFWR